MRSLSSRVKEEMSTFPVHIWGLPGLESTHLYCFFFFFFHSFFILLRGSVSVLIKEVRGDNDADDPAVITGNIDEDQKAQLGYQVGMLCELCMHSLQIPCSSRNTFLDQVSTLSD